MNRKQSLSLSVMLEAAVLAAANATAAFAAGVAEAPQTTIEAETDAEEYSLDEVVVTAARMPTTRMDTPANVSVVTAQEIADNHYKTAAEALQHVNGVAVGQTGTAEFISLNGNERVVLMVDGRRMNNEQGAATGKALYNLAMLPSMESIERIEVVKGGGSALYGSDAVGGVINIITKKAKANKTTLDLSGGSWGAQNYTLSTQGAAFGFDWFVSGGLQKRDYVKYKAGGASAGRSYPGSGDRDDNSFSANVGYALDDSSSVRAVFEHKSNHDSSWLYEANPRNKYRKPADAPRHEVFNNTALTYGFKETQTAPGFFRYYHNRRKTEFQGAFDTRMNGLEYQNGWEWGGHTVIAGADWHESTSSNPASFYSGSSMRNTAAYVQDTWKLGGKWSLVPGARMDHHSEFGTHWSPKLALNYNADNKTRVYASWGRVFRAPTADDLYTHNLGWATIGNPNLKPESGHTETIGLTHRLSRDATVEVSVYQTKLHDAIAWSMDSGTYIFSPVNMDSQRQRGMEISFKHRLSDSLSYDLGYSYLSQKGAEGGVERGNKYNDQPNGYRAGLHYKEGAFKANLFVTAKSGLEAANYVRKSYALVDLNLSYDVTKDLVVYLKGLNLTNQEYSSYAGAADNRYYGLGRRFMLGMTYSF